MINDVWEFWDPDAWLDDAWGEAAAAVMASPLYLSVASIERADGRSDATGRVILNSLVVDDVLNETPNTCTFRAMGFTPQVGQRVLVRLGDTPQSKLFAGSILSVRQSYLSKTSQPTWDVSCADDTWKLGLVIVSKRYTGQSATTIATDLITTYASAFATTDIQAALATIDEITFTNEVLTTCLTRLAARIGGYWYVDELESVHFFVTDTATDPDPLTNANPPLSVDTPFAIVRDLSQMITRVTGEGGGPAAMSDIAPGETIIPVGDNSWFKATGGTVMSGPQRITYGGIQEGGTGGLVGPGAAPAIPPAGAVTDGAGIEDGIHKYAYTFVTGAGESLASPLLSLETGSVAAPSSAPTAGSPTVGTGVTTGDHYYAVTFVTSVGETTSSPTSSTVSPGPITTGLIDPPASAPTLASTGGSGNSFIVVTYAITFYNGAGETTSGPSATDSFILGFAAPSASLTVINVGTGSIPAGTYTWYMTAVNSTGQETEMATIGTGGAGSAFDMRYNFTSPAANGGATAYKFYRTINGGAQGKLVGQTASSADTVFVDTVLDGALGANGPTINSTYEAVALSNIPVGPAGTTGRKVYATVPSGAQLKLLTTITNNTATTSTDTNPWNQARLGSNVPTSNTTATTTNYNQVPLTAIPIGPANITSRKVYRTAAGGAQLKLLTTIGDNTTTTYTDTTADGSLGANIPVTNTADANQVSLTSIAAGPSGTTSRKVYRTVAAGAQLKLLTTLADNTTLIYTDSTADASLGANAPTSDTSGLAQPDGQVNAGSTSMPCTGIYPSAGWVVIGNGQQVIRYTGTSAGSLTGIPASGIGAITATVNYSSSVTVPPQLLTIPASGAGSVLYTIQKGDPVNLFIIENDVAAQAVLAAAIGSGTGIVEEHIQDRRLTETELRARAQAVLAQRAQIAATVSYAIGGTTDIGCRDHRSGRTVAIDLPAMSVNDVFKIQSVRISGFLPGLEPVFTVDASTDRFSFEDLLMLARRNTGA